MDKLVDHDGLTVKILETLKQDIQIYVSLLLIVPLGFSTKFYSGHGQIWVRDSLSGVFYEILCERAR